MQFDLYYPDHATSDVTDGIVEVICDGVARAGHQMNQISKLKKQKQISFKHNIFHKCRSHRPKIGDTNDISGMNNISDMNKAIIVIDLISALKAKLCGYQFIICWVQGILPEESYYRHKSKLRFSILSAIEKMGLQATDIPIFTSAQMRSHYRRKYGIAKKIDYMIPCFNEEIHKDAFTDQRYQGNTFLYAGRLSVWQCFERTVALYKEIEKRIPDAKFLILTHEKEQAKIF